MRLRKLIVAAAVAASVWAAAPMGAIAYCEYETPDGGCSNSCKDTGRVVAKLTGGKVSWDCPQ